MFHSVMDCGWSIRPKKIVEIRPTPLKYSNGDQPFSGMKGIYIYVCFNWFITDYNLYFVGAWNNDLIMSMISCNIILIIPHVSLGEAFWCHLHRIL